MAIQKGNVLAIIGSIPQGKHPGELIELFIMDPFQALARSKFKIKTRNASIYAGARRPALIYIAPSAREPAPEYRYIGYIPIPSVFIINVWYSLILM